MYPYSLNGSRDIYISYVGNIIAPVYKDVLCVEIYISIAFRSRLAAVRRSCLG